jgi:hypothetical protein
VKLEYVKDKIGRENCKFILERDKRGIPYKVIARKANEKFGSRFTPKGIGELIRYLKNGLDQSRYEIE